MHSLLVTHHTLITVILYMYLTGSIISSTISAQCCGQTFDSYKEERERENYLVLVSLHWLADKIQD